MTRTGGPVERVYTITLVLDCTLIAIVTLWQLSAHVSLGRLSWAAVLTMPLWLPLRGLIRRHRRTYAAMTLCVTPYVVLGITEAVANPASRGWAAACLTCALSLFVMLVGYLRLTRDSVIPAQAGIHLHPENESRMDPRLRGDDGGGRGDEERGDDEEDGMTEKTR